MALPILEALSFDLESKKGAVTALARCHFPRGTQVPGDREAAALAGEGEANGRSPLWQKLNAKGAV